MNAIDRETLLRATSGPDALAPQVQLVSNGSYHVVLTSAGAEFEAGGTGVWQFLASRRNQGEWPVPLSRRFSMPAVNGRLEGVI